LTDTLNDAMVKENILQDTTAFDYSNRSEIQLLGKAKELQQLDLKRNKLGYLPTVAAFFSYQRQWQRNESFAAFTGANWFAFNTGLLGVNVSIPIFDGFQKKHKIQQSRFNIEKLDNSTAQLKRAIDLEQSVASSQVRNALLNLDVQSRNMQLAERVYNTTKKKYEQGLGNSFEVLQTDTELQRANGNYFQALYDAVVAKISYLKAVGKL
jgi:outer membrane protein